MYLAIISGHELSLSLEVSQEQQPPDRIGDLEVRGDFPQTPDHPFALYAISLCTHYFLGRGSRLQPIQHFIRFPQATTLDPSTTQREGRSPAASQISLAYPYIIPSAPILAGRGSAGSYPICQILHMKFQNFPMGDTTGLLYGDPMGKGDFPHERPPTCPYAVTSVPVFWEWCSHIPCPGQMLYLKLQKVSRR